MTSRSELIDAIGGRAASGVWTTIESFREDVADVAQVTEHEPAPGVREVEFRPANPDGATVRLFVGVVVVVILGEASRFELGLGDPDRQLLAQLLDAAQAGRLREVSDMFGTAYEVWLADGSERTGRVVQIRWRGRSTREYAAWRSPGL